jgi:hypothetical protein
MPTSAPADLASARALRASPVAPTVSFAVLGLVTVLALGLLGLSQQASVTGDRAPAGGAVRAPHLVLAGPSDVPRAASPLLPDSLRMVVPVARSAVRSAAGPGAAFTHDGAVVIGQGSVVAAELPGQSGTTEPVRQPQGAAALPLARATTPATSPVPAQQPAKQSGPTPVVAHPAQPSAHRPAGKPAKRGDAKKPRAVKKPRAEKGRVALQPTVRAATLLAVSPPGHRTREHQGHGKARERGHGKHGPKGHGTHRLTGHGKSGHAGHAHGKSGHARHAHGKSGHAGQARHGHGTHAAAKGHHGRRSHVGKAASRV